MPTKKEVAAVAAVIDFLKTQEEISAAMAAESSGAAEVGPPQPASPANLWGVSGRQSMMQMKTMMQMKAFHRIGR